jgi:hypothetical protein
VTVDPIPPTAVVRVSRGSFDPARFAEVREMSLATSRFLIPAIEKLPGLIRYYAATSPEGVTVHVSIWESDEHAEQLSRLREMIVDARREAEAVGVTFDPIINHPVDWTI